MKWLKRFRKSPEQRLDEHLERILKRIASEHVVFQEIKEEIHKVKEWLDDAMLDQVERRKDISKILENFHKENRMVRRAARKIYHEEEIIRDALASEKIHKKVDGDELQRRLEIEVTSLLKDIENYRSELRNLIFNFKHFNDNERGAIDALLLEVGETVEDAERWLAALSSDVNLARELHAKFIENAHFANEKQAAQLVKEGKFDEAIQLYRHLGKHQKIIHVIGNKLDTRNLLHYTWKRDIKEHNSLLQYLEDAYKNLGDFRKAVSFLLLRVVHPPQNENSREWASEIYRTKNDLINEIGYNKSLVLIAEEIFVVNVSLNEMQRNVLAGYCYLETVQKDSGNYQKTFDCFEKAGLLTRAMHICSVNSRSININTHNLYLRWGLARLIGENIKINDGAHRIVESKTRATLLENGFNN